MDDFRNIEELRREAKRRLPRGVFDQLDRGAEDELALSENRRALDELKMSPRVLVDIAKRDTSTSLFGKPVAAPFAVSPTGAGGMFWFEGDLAVARAAASLGVPMALSTGSMSSMERVVDEVGGRIWFQLYIYRNRKIADVMVDRALAAGVEALILTVDSPVSPNREYNHRNGFDLPFRLRPRNIIDVLSHPSWCFNVLMRYLLTGGLPKFENFPPAHQTAVAKGISGDARPGSASWEDVRWLRAKWRGPLIVKGILSSQDALLAADAGVDGIVVSNHGGRILDSAPPVPWVLPAIAEAVGSRLTVLADSGVRRGSDIAKYLALGAKGVLIGRAPLYGVAAAGEAGAARALGLLQEELSRIMALLGVTSVEQIGADILRTRPLT